MRTVILESPWAGDIEAHQVYAQRAMHDCLTVHNEAPFASHLLYTQPNVLDDLVPSERALGVNAGLEIGKRLEATVVYTDYGISNGMQIGIDSAKQANRPIEERQIGKNPIDKEQQMLDILERLGVANDELPTIIDRLPTGNLISSTMLTHDNDDDFLDEIMTERTVESPQFISLVDAAQKRRHMTKQEAAEFWQSIDALPSAQHICGDDSPTDRNDEHKTYQCNLPKNHVGYSHSYSENGEEVAGWTGPDYMPSEDRS